MFNNEKELGLVELIEDVNELEESAGAGWTWNLVFSSVISLGLGNDGYVCTWTYECQSNCQ